MWFLDSTTSVTNAQRFPLFWCCRSMSYNPSWKVKNGWKFEAISFLPTRDLKFWRGVAIFSINWFPVRKAVPQKYKAHELSKEFLMLPGKFLFLFKLYDLLEKNSSANTYMTTVYKNIQMSYLWCFVWFETICAI